MRGFCVDAHFVGEVETATATSAMGFWDEGCDGRLCCCNLSCLGSSECSLDDFECRLSFLC